MEERFFPAPAAEARPIGSPDAPADDGRAPPAIDDPRALQILSTEHWSLLTARSLVYNETFARGGMFLAMLSASLLVLGLIATATGFSEAFLMVAALDPRARPVRRPCDAGADRRRHRTRTCATCRA